MWYGLFCGLVGVYGLYGIFGTTSVHEMLFGTVVVILSGVWVETNILREQMSEADKALNSRLDELSREIEGLR